MQQAADYDADSSLIVSIAGPPKSAKSYFACTAPWPIMYHQFDLGSFKRVKPHLSSEILANIQIESYKRVVQQFTDDKIDPDMQAAAKPVWAHFVKTYKDSVLAAAPDHGTIVLDTETIEWDLNQYANVAQDTAAKKRAAMVYGRANEEQAGMIDFARSHGVNLILLHQEKETWEKDPESGQFQPSGKFVPAMHKHTPALVDVRCRMFKPVKEGSMAFQMLIKDSGVNPKAEGTWVNTFGPCTWENFRLALGV